MNCTRDWRNHIPSLGVKLEGGLLKDDTGNHFFMTIQRRGKVYVWGLRFEYSLLFGIFFVSATMDDYCLISWHHTVNMLC